MFRSVGAQGSAAAGRLRRELTLYGTRPGPLSPSPAAAAIGAMSFDPKKFHSVDEQDRHRSNLSEVTWYSLEDAAERAGVEPSYLPRLVDLGILPPAESGRFSSGDVRRVLMAKSLED